jgi:hypothetical protein
MWNQGDPELPGENGKVESLASARDRERKCDDPGALPAHAAAVDLNRSPQRDRAGHEIASPRGAQRDLAMPGVHAAGAVRVGRSRRSRCLPEDIGTAPRVQFAAPPTVVGPQRMKRAVPQAPLPEPDHGPNEVGRRKDVGRHGRGSGSRTGSGRSRGSTSGPNGGVARCGGAGTTSGSTVMRRDGPGMDPRQRPCVDTATITWCCTSGLQDA